MEKPNVFTGLSPETMAALMAMIKPSYHLSSLSQSLDIERERNGTYLIDLKLDAIIETEDWEGIEADVAQLSDQENRDMFRIAAKIFGGNAATAQEDLNALRAAGADVPFLDYLQHEIDKRTAGQAMPENVEATATAGQAMPENVEAAATTDEP